MLFNSWQFAVFFAVVFFAYYLLPHRYRSALLLIASYFFYMSWNAKLVSLIAGVTAVTYAAALLIGRAEGVRKKKAYAAAGIVLPLAVLFFFKYWNFFGEGLSALIGQFSAEPPDLALSVLLPVGISFYTFQALSYVIDVYRQKLPPERDFARYALYISFFPQLVAGPIERSTNLLPQFGEEHAFSEENAADGLRLMAIGYFKKLVIADLLAMKIDPVFAHVTGYRGFSLVLATFLFAVQIYCDFSGYSDIAIGAAKMFGFRLMKNFDSPYFARSIKEFWRRWHISLSSWLSDYVYIPLGGSRVSLPRHCVNLLLTFVISGLWHGANWTFVCWGLVHGLYMVCGVLFSRIPFPEKWKAAADKGVFLTARRLFVFALVCAAWVFFRAETVSDAFHVFRFCLEGASAPLRYLSRGIEEMNFRFDGIAKPAIGMIVLFCIDRGQLRADPVTWLKGRKPAFRVAVSVLFVLMILLFSEKGIASSFLYFQF